MNAKPEILVLDAAAAQAAIDELADVLVDCVEGGASVSFMLPFSRDDAAKFFEKVIASVARGETVLVAAKLDGRIVGTVQLGLDMPPNQPHRGDIRKLLVHRAARNHGIGAALMARAEAEAKARGRTLLVLDTAGARSRAALCAQRLAARRRRAGLRDVAAAAASATRRFSGRRFERASPLVPALRGGARRGSHLVHDRRDMLDPLPSPRSARARERTARGGYSYAAATCPASQPSIARLRVSPQ